MVHLDQNKLRELLEISDVSFRVASFLRQLKSGRISDDIESIDQAINFLNQAEYGGLFMSSGNLIDAINSLQPLNWAADIFQQDDQKIDYNKLNNYLNEIISSLNQVKTDSTKAKDQNLDQSINFFFELGQTLTSEINQNTCNDSQSMNY